MSCAEFGPYTFKHRHAERQATGGRSAPALASGQRAITEVHACRQTVCLRRGGATTR